MYDSKKMTTIHRAKPDQAGELTALTIASKRHWNYPERWIQIWLPLMTVSPEYIRENETWAVLEDGKRVGYYSLKHDGGFLWLDNLWILPEFIGKGLGRELFQRKDGGAKSRRASHRGGRSIARAAGDGDWAGGASVICFANLLYSRNG